MFVKGPDEVGPFSCQRTDLAGSQGSLMGMESGHPLTPSLPFSCPPVLKKNLNMHA